MSDAEIFAAWECVLRRLLTGCDARRSRYGPRWI